MDLYSIGLFKGLRQQMSWLHSRQKVIAQNVANADTPNYQAKDLEKPDFSNMLQTYRNQSVTGGAGNDSVRSAALGGHKPHAAPGPGLSLDGGVEQATIDGWETSPSGNSVTLEEEMMRMAETQVAYQTATNLYKKSIGLLRTAVRGA